MMLFLSTTPQLSETDVKIYQYILNHLESVQYMRIRDLANEIHTSTATILRFCRKLDCQGYSEFRIRLQSYIHEKEEIKPIDEKPYIQFLQSTKESLFIQNMDKAINILKNQELILFTGEGLSKMIAGYGAAYFSSYGYLAICIDHMSHFLYQNMTCKFCMIILAESKETKPLIEQLQSFHQENIPIICITQHPQSTLAKLCDVCMTYQISNTASQFPALYMIEYLANQTHKAKSCQLANLSRQEYGF